MGTTAATGLDTFAWIEILAKVIPFVLIILHVSPIMIWLERRGSAWMQNRSGPNRAGPLGLLHSLADAIKMMMKEDFVPGQVVSKFFYLLAPIVSVTPAFMTIAVVPFASQLSIDGRVVNFQIADLNVGMLYIFSIASLGVYGIIMGGWASNNKYSLLGSLRSSSQMISYELSMGLSVIGIIMVFSTVNLQEIAAAQGQTLLQLGPLAIPKWGIFIQPVGFVIFLTAIFAETNRLPFDLPEGESEIIAGYHLEYGSMKFAIFMMAEYTNMFVGAAFLVTLFFGGWQLLPGMHWVLENLVGGQLGITGFGYEVARVVFEFTSFMIKVAFFNWFYIWVRWTLPRFRYDQLMDLGWKIMLPLALLNIFATGVLVYYKVL